ncbi:methylase [Bellilinea caldifistulae]|uniref:Methyltransferase type 11 domain-containing protein n=1 Tax=Bellilinea caldifistulae TaxID=360411 RepID=A0A0P6XKZ1_9CHLR|nr:class I SAM-dependent methyltransferase [Bellilinea caldifistulae]KPL72312.1 hypothetical protein AC812_15865 [Bellilinea caldifistulae]GAP09498.1 methylase [Bellilinea caldifistulae]
MKKNIPLGNYYNKYTSNNLLVKFFVNKYKSAFQYFLTRIKADNILEIGSGEGYIVRYVRDIYPEVHFFASDIDWHFVKSSAKNNSDANWVVCFGENLPFSENTFDLVIACEVLEHVSSPELVLKEIQRVGNGWTILSVPNEPWWQLLNLARMKYIKSFGNTPGHIQHWNLKSFSNLIKNYIIVHNIQYVFPWIFAIGKFKKPEH